MYQGIRIIIQAGVLTLFGSCAYALPDPVLYNALNQEMSLRTNAAIYAHCPQTYPKTVTAETLEAASTQSKTHLIALYNAQSQQQQHRPLTVQEEQKAIADIMAKRVKTRQSADHLFGQDGCETLNKMKDNFPLSPL